MISYRTELASLIADAVEKNTLGTETGVIHLDDVNWDGVAGHVMSHLGDDIAKLLQFQDAVLATFDAANEYRTAPLEGLERAKWWRRFVSTSQKLADIIVLERAS